MVLLLIFTFCFNEPNSTFGLCLTRVEKEKTGSRR
jgi:hypothetical protein